MVLGKFKKQPAEIKDYDINYAEWLAPSSDTIDGATAVITCLSVPADNALVCSQVTYSTTAVKFWIQGGTDGKKYKLTASITTDGGRRDECELIFTIKET